MPVRGYANGGPPMEQLDSIMMTGGPSNVPMGTPGMGGPPPGPPMGGPPPGMGGPPPGPPMGQDPMMALMGNEAALGQGGMERGMEGGMSIEEDAGALAEAVVGRAKGDIGAAVAILDTAKEMLMAGGQEPMMANMGRPLMRRANGGAMSTQMPQQGGRTISPSPMGAPPPIPPMNSPKPMGGMQNLAPAPPMPQESRMRRGPGFANGGGIGYSDLIRKNREDLLYDQGKA